MAARRRRKKDSNTGLVLGILGFVLFMLGLMFASTIGTVDPDGARSFLLRKGFYDVEINGRAYLTCGVDYRFHTSFRARDNLGRLRTGAVCSGGTQFNSVVVLDE